MERPATSSGARRIVSRMHTIRQLVDALAHPDGAVRMQARESLIDIGGPAVRPLLPVLWTGDSQARWEAAKILAAVPDAAATHALVRCLEDPDAGTRWVAAEALVALRLHALRPLLHALAVRGQSPELRQGAHHVLHDLEAQRLLPPSVDAVIDALEGPAPEDGARWAAARALDRVERGSRLLRRPPSGGAASGEAPRRRPPPAA